jgi:site-specific recombinase XerD
MASLRKHKGHYNARFYDKNRSPQRKEVSLGTTRKSVAEPKLRRIEEAYARGDYDPWRGGWLIENKPLAEAGENFIESKKQAGLRPNTVSVYYYVLEGLKEHTPPGIMTRDVSADHVQSYVHAPKEQEGVKKAVSNATKRHRHSHLRTFFRWAMERGWIDENPVEEVKKPRKEQKKKAFLQKEGLEKLLASIDAHRKLRQGEPGPTPNDEWLKQMIVVAVTTGMRRGELLNLRWVDVDLDGKKLLVRNRDDFRAKNGQERFVHLVGNALDVMRRMYEARDPLPNLPVFIDDRGKPPRPDRVSKRFKFYVRKAKLKNREDLHFHSLRHTTASWLTMNNYSKKVVADVLGHTTTRMADVYSHLAPGATERAMEQTFGGE